MQDDFEALCPAPDSARWERFLRTLEQRGRARLALAAELASGGEPVGDFHGQYVALRPE